MGTLNIAECMLQESINNLIFSGSCATFGAPESMPINETYVQNPISPYGKSKVASENIINDFLLNEPEVITEELDDSWHEMGLNDRLNYRSPIPLNAEQYKILKALKKDNCKYVVVEGPPGTGKSHTISAIAFDYILDDKSILILSDTREALDVVENKINDTLNKVRGKNVLQNPILRLGKMGNTYNKILAKSSIDNIRTFHRAQKNNIKAIDKDIKDIKKLAKKYDAFLAVAPLMGKVATKFGRIFGPMSKMPSPQAGIIVKEDEASIKAMIEKIKKVIRVKNTEMSIKLPIGKEDMDDKMLEENITAVINGLEKKLPRGPDNIREVLIKCTMTKPIKIMEKEK